MKNKFLCVIALCFLLLCSGCFTGKRLPAPEFSDPKAVLLADRLMSYAPDCGPMFKGVGRLAIISPESNIKARMIFGVIPDIPRLRLELLGPMGQPFFRLAIDDDLAQVQLPEENQIRTRANIDSDLNRLTGMPISATQLSFFLSGYRLLPGWTHANFYDFDGGSDPSLSLYYPQWNGYLHILSSGTDNVVTAVWTDLSGVEQYRVSWIDSLAEKNECLPYNRLIITADEQRIILSLSSAFAAPVPAVETFRLTAPS